MKIYVRWHLKQDENKYYVLDWAYQKPESIMGGGFEEVEVDEKLIKTMMKIDKDNMEYEGYFKTVEELKEHMMERGSEVGLKPEESFIDEIEWTGENHYIAWNLLHMPICITNALEALEEEYETCIEDGQWITELTGWERKKVKNTKDMKDCLMDLYGCKDISCEQNIQEYILSFFSKSELDKENYKTISDDINNIGLSTHKRDEIFDLAPAVNMIAPAYFS